jgi:hypothetical protein
MPHRLNGMSDVPQPENEFHADKTPEEFAPDADLSDEPFEELDVGPPSWLAPDLAGAAREEIHLLLSADQRLLGDAYRARRKHPTLSATALHQYTEAANVGALHNLLTGIQVISGEKIPKKLNPARSARSNVRSIRKRAQNNEAIAHLNDLEMKLDEVISDPAAGDVETAELAADSSKLEAEANQDLNGASGVYVYTYPHYWRYPYREDSERRMFKVGRTAAGAWDRVKKQSRTTGMPEDPRLLRVYVSENIVENEAKFHKILDAAEHERSKGLYCGKEWFVTTIDFLDTVAWALGMNVKKPPSADD